MRILVKLPFIRVVRTLQFPKDKRIKTKGKLTDRNLLITTLTEPLLSIAAYSLSMEKPFLQRDGPAAAAGVIPPGTG
jgi:hypothetical protein